MGMFSTKKKTVVNTSVSRLVEDEDIPDSGKAALFDYLYSSKSNRNNTIETERSLSDFIALNNANSIGSKLRQSRSWAKNKYVYGVPEGDVLNSNQVDISSVLDEYLTTTLGQPVRMGYAMMNPLNALHFTWMMLATDHLYDYDNNTLAMLSAQKGVPVYLKDIQINYCKDTIDSLVDPDTVIQLGMPATWGVTDTRTKNVKRPQTNYIKNETTSHDYALVTYTYKLGNAVYEGTFDIDFLDYEYSGNPPEDGLDDASNEIKEPDAITPIVEDTRREKDYFMVEYFTKDVDNVEHRHYFTYEYGSGEILELDRLFHVNKTMGIYYPNIYFRLMGTKLTDNAYKDTNEYKSSILMCRKLGLNWLNISDELHNSIGSVGSVVQILLSTQLNINSGDDLTNRYMYEYFYSLYNQLPKQFAFSYYANLTSDYVNGFAKVGQTVYIRDKAYASRLSFKSIGYIDVEGSIGDVGAVTLERQHMSANGSKGWISASTSIHVICKQLTENTYRKITVYGLTTTQEVQGGYATTASGDSGNLIIPLDETIVAKFGVKERNLLYSKSLVFIINTIDVIKTKWYASKIFKAIMFIIAVVVSIFTNGAGMSIYTVLYAVAQTLIIGLIVNIAVRFLVEKMNMNIGGIFAVVAIILIIYGGASALGKMNIMGMTSAQFMQAANIAVQISSAGTQMEMKEMLKAHNVYSNLMQEQFDELDKVKEELLQADAYLNINYLLSDSIRGPDIRIGESMNTFLVRTLSVDIGLAPLDTIPNMVALTVRLPTFEQTYNNYMKRGE